MAAGNQPTRVQLDNTLSQLAVQLRELCQQILWQQAQAIKLGTAGLEALSPGAVTAIAYTSPEATDVLARLGYMATVAGCYKGTVQQGGTGGTGASLFNFEDALTSLWAGQ